MHGIRQLLDPSWAQVSWRIYGCTEEGAFAPWALMDFRSPTRNIPLLQAGFNRKGLISENGKRKLALSFIRKGYKDTNQGEVGLLLSSAED